MEIHNLAYWKLEVIRETLNVENLINDLTAKISVQGAVFDEQDGNCSDSSKSSSLFSVLCL